MRLGAVIAIASCMLVAARPRSAQCNMNTDAVLREGGCTMSLAAMMNQLNAAGIRYHIEKTYCKICQNICTRIMPRCLEGSDCSDDRDDPDEECCPSGPGCEEKCDTRRRNEPRLPAVGMRSLLFPFLRRLRLILEHAHKAQPSSPNIAYIRHICFV